MTLNEPETRRTRSGGNAFVKGLLLLQTKETVFERIPHRREVMCMEEMPPAPVDSTGIEKIKPHEKPPCPFAIGSLWDYRLFTV